MTEKEFENLKVGDKVWVGVDWFSDNPKKDEITSFKVEGKEWGEETIGSVVFCGGISIKRHRCFLTKTEAWEYKVKCYEDFLDNHRKALDRYKAELAKAKEEEKKAAWVVLGDCAVQISADDSMYDNYIKYETKQKAYEAIANYYKDKYEEALVKSGKARFVILCGDKICLVQGVEKGEGNMVWVYDCDGFSLYVPKENVFPTRQEAEAELERRKKND